MRRQPLGAYVTLAVLIGVRNEELRALTWDHVDLVGIPDAVPPVPPSIRVWRSVRARGDTKTRLSRRALALPAQAVEAVQRHRVAMQEAGLREDRALVFCTANGTALDPPTCGGCSATSARRRVSMRGSGHPAS